MGKETKPVITQKDLKVSLSSKAVEGERTIVAVVSSSNFDRDNERVDVKSLRLPLKTGGSIVAKDLTGNEVIDIPLLINHSFDVEDVIGSVRKAYLNEANELVFELGIANTLKAVELMKVIDGEHLDNAFSITMSDYMYSDSTIFDAEVLEVSLVFRGSNKDARILAVKSLIKGENAMAEAIVEQEAEIEVAEAEVVKTEAEVAEVETKENVEAEEIAESEAEVVEADKEINKSVEKESKEMSDKTIAVKQVKDPVEVEVIEKKAKMLSKNAQRNLFVKQFVAFQKGDTAELARLNKEVIEGTNSKSISADDISGIFQTEVVASDIKMAYDNVGSIGSLVSRIDITGAETWRQPIQSAGNGFQPVGVEEEKQEDKPVWSSMFVTPKEHAMIVAWFDSMAKRTPLAVYQTVIAYIAKEYKKLEAKIVLTFAGATSAGGDVFAPTGLYPILKTANKVVDLDSYESADILAAFGEAFGLIKSDETLTIACNRATWGALATSVDGFGKATFTVVGEQVAIGALGSFNVNINNNLADGAIVFGAFSDYQLVTIGGLETLFSQHATVGELNLFTSDASALRACTDIAGKPVFADSFVVIELVAVS
jgi:hypothetical protein